MDSEEAIRRAICDDQPAVLRQVLAENPALRARINDPLGPFDSPLILQARSREMLDALLEAGADINARSKWWAGGFGLLDQASDEVAAYALERGARLDVHSAARLNRLGELERMLRADPGAVRARGGDGKTPLHWVRTVEAARLLVEHGADINARDVDHESTPAQYLVQEHQDVVRYLIGCGCETDIFLAAALGDNELAKRLIESDPGCLRMRVNHEHFPMRIPRAGGTIYQWTLGFNISPQEVARKFGHEDTYRLLMERSPAEVQLLVQCWSGSEAEVKSTLAANPGLVARLAASEQRQLADAARNNNAAAVRLMCLAGLPVTVRGQHAGTPLHWAAWHGNAEMVRVLLSHRATLEDAANEFKATPLGWAIHGSENGWYRENGNYPETVRALLAAGAAIPPGTNGTAEVRNVLEHAAKGKAGGAAGFD